MVKKEGKVSGQLNICTNKAYSVSLKENFLKRLTSIAHIVIHK